MNTENGREGSKREVILSSAIRVFTKKGFAATSMDEIVEDSGVSKRTIYNYFQSKEKLFQEIVADFVAQRDRKKEIAYSPTETLEPQLRAFAMAEFHFVDDPVRRGLSRLLTSTFLMDPDFAKAVHTQYVPHGSFIAWLEAAGKDGRLDVDSPALAARVFYGLVEGCITWAALLTDGASLATVEPVLSEIIQVFLCRYRPAQASATTVKRP